MTARKTAATEMAVATNTAIPGTLTADDYIARINAMLVVGQNIARRAGWCGEWYSYLNAISRSFPASSDDTVSDVPASPTFPREWFTDDGWTAFENLAGTERSRELHNIRGRILHWVDNGNLSLDDANNTLHAGGIPQYGTDGTKRTYLAYFPAVFVRANPDATTATRELTDQFRQFLAEHADEPASTETGGTHSDNMTVDLDAHRRRGGISIPAEQVIEPLTRNR